MFAFKFILSDKSVGWQIAKVVGEIPQILGSCLLCLHRLDSAVFAYVHANVMP